METDVTGATSFSDIDLEAPISEYGKFIDTICPLFLMYGMSWHDFWFESIERLPYYWQMYQYDIERKNQELWLQGIYIQEAVAVVLDSKHKAKYPKEPHRITALSDAEKEAEKQRKIDLFREQLNQMSERWKATHKERAE